MFNDSTSPDDKDLFELLANFRRRRLLHHLFDRDGEASLRELSRAVAADEMDSTPEEVNSDETTNVYISLYQTHIPALEEREIIEYDDTERIVALGRRSGDIDAILQNTRSYRRGAVYYLIVALALGIIVAVSTLQSIPMSDQVVSVSTVASTAIMLTIAIDQYYRTSDR